MGFFSNMSIDLDDYIGYVLTSQENVIDEAVRAYENGEDYFLDTSLFTEDQVEYILEEVRRRTSWDVLAGNWGTK